MRLGRTIALAAAIAVRPAAAEDPGFSPGETIDLSVDYLHVHAGQAHITVGRPQGRIWPVTCRARTDGLAGVLDIREHYVAYWDAEARLPHGSDLAAIEVGDRHFDTSRFDRVLGKATISVLRRGRRSERSYDVPREAHDIGSALLYLRTVPLAPGGHLELPVFSGDKTFQFFADVVGRETIATPAGRFDTVKVKVRTAFEGKFSTRRDTSIWLSDDPRHIPVRLSAEFAVGTVVATLVGYHPGSELAQR